ncbi:ArsR/SmtB family transcription factor [Rhodococcus jostii]|uniref:DNA-binding transcriptional regulator, ArsR family n=1 Tax=Rhodococcus jostii TaxID=132919 RepID=A0A1H4J9I4_RHOJO|nr:metalloregulator ArsR/SmtB family transcription factor [Rhodococcus jostii]SEB42980.1 DNA-binding transcriptional regulator, ArsR family [Rhodococcus jostii]
MPEQHTEIRRPSLPLADVLKALGDPTRLEIIRQMSVDGEVACTTLEKTLHVSKATISYHIKTLHNVDLVTIRKEGRFYFYALRADALEAYVPGFSAHLRTLPRI